MQQKSIFIIESYEQLKVISDPLRTKMLIFLVEQPHTGQMLAQELNLSRAKILYHLRELEKHKIIQLVRKEERGGNILKFYQAVARGFIPADHLLNYVESKDATRQSYLEVIDRAKTRVLTAPDKSFELNSSNVEEWPKLSIQKEFKVSKEKFLEFTSKYRELLEKLEEKDTDIEKQNYYLMTTAFQIEEPLFKNK
ncbi:winged helix-turn-helix domain-containing protein [Cytobacillus solani]|uniref:ArsR family transcriptional regulator n=1 Tax=Cytobacillus solani TaxID=1637975 RepID=A0A0Q3VH72_9BACI|nr:winged helix-turn-helix domain-containing protein [Cytobacillus solani]KOP82440.1 ArsR family transcriptional regulator [Bacillus sp. FJAT-21945]KQL19450.1 ArsR family transcriptional regulator [Cytobacillus solani]USK57411.1 winged helix-turn-helix domain-containing protein [Cytobacillus solani]